MTDRRTIGRDTVLCMSLSARPGTFGSRFHNHLYEALGLDWIYKAFTTIDLASVVAGIRALGIRGCAVSMPFKEACIPMLDALDASAKAIDSVNTIVNDGGKLTGHNTDYGAIAPLLAKHGVAPGADFALHGSGGMAKAVTAALRDAGFTRGTVVARNRETGGALAARYGYGWQETLGASRPRMLVNVTPIGMQGGPEARALAFPEEVIAKADVVFDVVAVPVETPLVRAGRAAGKTVITGGEVIVLQAVEQFALYTGIRPTAEQVSAAADYALAVP
ncbi:MAG: shikimate 5-dehydrogenase [Myxococcota bacterium]